MTATYMCSNFGGLWYSSPFSRLGFGISGLRFTNEFMILGVELNITSVL